MGKERTTQKNYTALGKNLELFLQANNLTLKTVQPIDLKQFIYEVATNEQGQLVKNSAFCYKKFLKTFMRAIGRMDLVESLKLMKEIKQENRFQVDLTLEEILRLIQVTKNTQLKLAWSLMAFDGLRPGEVLGLFYQDLDLEKKQVYLLRREGELYFPKCAKVGQPPKTIPLNDLSAELFRHLPYKRGERILPFSYKTLRKWFTRYAAQANITRTEYKITMHKLRHFFGHLWMKRKGDIRTLQKLLRHSNINYTLIYTAPTDAEIRTEFKRVITV